MRVILISINHHHAPLELRERFAEAGDTSLFLQAARDRYPGIEAAAISTCNRYELYIARPIYSPPKPESLRAFIAEYFDLPFDKLASACIIREQEQAVAHLFRVCCGLDSMVLGEAQVLGQVKRAYESAASQGYVGPVLHRIFQQAIATAKQARTTTGIDAGRVSIGSVAADLTKQVIPDLNSKTIVGIGAGEIAELTLQHILALKPHRLWLVNRTGEIAGKLSQSINLHESVGGVRPWNQLDALLAEADVVICSTSATEPILTTRRFTHIHKHRRGRPIVFIDLAVPRDIDPALGSMSNVYLYNLDDLKEQIEHGFGQRNREAEACEQLITHAAAVCMNQVRHADLGQLIRRLRTKLHDMGDIESQRTLRKLAQNSDPGEVEEALNEHTRRLINKFLHLPLEQLDRHKPDAPLGFYAAAIRRLFDLVEQQDADGSSSHQSSTAANQNYATDVNSSRE